MTTAGFRDSTIAAFWKSISASLDTFESILAACTFDELNWQPPAPGTNSIYVLAVHSLGHLRQGVLGVLGGQSEERDREAEFAGPVATADTVPVPGWLETRAAMDAVLRTLPTEALGRMYEPVGREPMTGAGLLALMTRHTALHEGHMEITRDLVQAAR